ncbi:hypothetical protein AVEN_132888-1 [Araneus ventricosus]|uniref:Uncharacterized protein n=1 Tax=Araneus ventricosus TaxID=182803 RepID=A0A4Y2VRG5_ARAVE|nr:hypothetical protein AVEN_4410-1 [Araneus ventricosus]GBO27252.1 hypothetical protein AVEN_132888-1 [Araneus ventricosus]
MHQCAEICSTPAIPLSRQRKAIHSMQGERALQNRASEAEQWGSGASEKKDRPWESERRGADSALLRFLVDGAPKKWASDPGTGSDLCGRNEGFPQNTCA